MSDEDKLYFGIEARHVSQLGRELVADRITAVSELIKNAYDADATVVNVRFLNASENSGGVLEISDNGVGMSLHDVRTRWMRLSTDFKERNLKSELYGRVRAGRKGIGRFATESLGSRLILTTVAKDSGQQVRVTFDWTQFYVSGADLTKIPNMFRMDSVDEQCTGTSLRIEELHDAWPREALDAIQRAVALLQPPFPLSKPQLEIDRTDPGFVVSISDDTAYDAPRTTGFDAFRSAATAHITGAVDSSGSGTWRINSRVLNLKLEKTANTILFHSGPFTFDAAYFVYERGAIGSLALRDAQEMGSKYGGIRMYRDGLRILPYGEKGDDWLGLDYLYTRRVVLPPVANNNWFGFVSISRQHNPQLRDTASREGVVENTAFEEVKSFVREGLVWSAREIAAARGRKVSAGDRAPKPISRKRMFAEVLGDFNNALDLALRGKSREARRILEGTTKKAIRSAKTQDRLERRGRRLLVEEIQLLRVLASLGTSIAVFSHEVKAVLNQALGALSDVEELVRRAGGRTRESLISVLGPAQTALSRLESLGRYIEGYVSQTRRREREALAVHEVVRHFSETFSKTLNQRKIELVWGVAPAHLRTVPIYRAEFEAVLFNFLTNAIKALDREGQRERRIKIDVLPDDGNVLLRFQDTGAGIDPDILPRVFDPFVTASYLGEAELGVGTGLGLKIVRDIAEAYGGSALVGSPDIGFRTAFEFRIPKASLDVEV